MVSFNYSRTSLSLLSALNSDARQHDAWPMFVDRYGKRIHGWCRRWGLQEADAHDVTQNVLLQLARQMKSYQYDSNGRFRSWLKTIAWRAWADYLSARKRNMALPGCLEQLAQLDTVAAKDDLLQRIDDEADQEILEVALNRIKSRVQETTFQSFFLMAFEQLSGTQTAEQLGISVANAFAAKSRVDKMLSEEVALLTKQT